MAESRVLVIDDEPANLRLIEQVLRPGFNHLLLLDDPRRVASELVAFAPDVVVLDLHMPFVDGYEVLSMIRSSAGDDYLPVLVLTADVSPDAKRRALALGATDFLTKPLDVIETALRVANLARTRHLHRALSDENTRLELVVTERTGTLAAANRRLEELLRSRDEFLASISHELRTPLSVVVGLAAELRDGKFTPEEAAELIDIIAEQSTEMAHIVEDLLVAARTEQGVVAVVPEEVDVAQVVDTVLRPLPLAARRRIVTSIPAGLVVRADAPRIRQILRNLVSNALRYGGEAIDIEAWEGEASATIAVSDNGPGLSFEERERVFDAYHSAHSRGTQPASVGLGLTVCRQLARLMGGDVTYRSDNAGGAFVLELPAPSRRAVPSHVEAERP